MGMLMLFYEMTTTVYEMEEICVRKDNDFDADISEEEFERILEQRKTRRQSQKGKEFSYSYV